MAARSSRHLEHVRTVAASVPSLLSHNWRPAPSAIFEEPMKMLLSLEVSDELSWSMLP